MPAAQAASAAVPPARVEGLSALPGPIPTLLKLDYGNAEAVERLRTVNRISAEAASPRNR